MPSTYTPRNRYTKQAAGEGLNVWGTILNTGAFDRIDESTDGVTTISASGATTLTSANGTPHRVLGHHHFAGLAMLYQRYTGG